MSRRRGILALWLLFLLAALAAVGAGVLRASSHARQTAMTEEKGLIAQYAAESGAVWGLEQIKANGLASGTFHFTLHDGAACTVKMTLTSDDGTVRKGKIHSTGEETGRGFVRYVGLMVESEKSGETWSVVVTDVGNKRSW